MTEDDWAWVRYTTEDLYAVMAQLADITSPVFTAEHEVARRGVTAEIPMAGIAVTQGGTCGVMVLPTDLPLDALATDFVAWMDGQPGSHPGGATLTNVALPATEAKRIDVSNIEDGWQAPRDFDRCP